EPQDGHVEHELRIDRAGRYRDGLVGVQQYPECALKIVGRALRRLDGQRLDLRVGKAGEQRAIAGRAEDRQVPEVLEQVATEAAGGVALRGGGPQGGGARAPGARRRPPGPPPGAPRARATPPPPPPPPL